MSSKIREVDFTAISTYLSEHAKKKLLVVIDVNVWELYAKKINLKELQKNLNVIIWKSPAGEKTKNYHELERCVEFFLSKGVSRHDHLVAIGGGATSDFAGLVASLLVRGIDWSVIPTTLLSMVDASIGGKVGINSKFGKNLIGAFHHPHEILVQSAFLETLAADEFQSGLGEVLKYGFLSPKIAQLILKGADLQEVAKTCAAFKQEIVLKDAKEKGERIQLNLGHTLGHAFEPLYNIAHGKAVVWGMAALFCLFEDQESLKKLSQLKTALGVEVTKAPWFDKSIPFDDIKSYLSKDKKNISQGKLNLVLPLKKGSHKTLALSLDEFMQMIKDRSFELQKLTI